MANARNTLFLNTIAFVRERFGPDAHSRVARQLSPAAVTAISTAVREAAWRPLDDLVAYMETARAVLAPGDESLYREMGRFAGDRDRTTRAVGVMMTAATAERTAPVMWRTFFDVGRVEVAARDGASAVLLIHDFPASATLCQRISGSLEGQFECSVEETRCIALGDACCERQLRWTA